jgi:Ca-activated chloride channel family protein
VAAYRLIGYENRMLEARDFNNDRKDAGEMGAGHSVTALYEVVPADGAGGPRGPDPLRYQPAQRREPAASPEFLYVKVRYKAPDAERSELIALPVSGATDKPSVDFRFQAAVAEFGLLLRNSKHKGDAHWGRVVTQAQNALGEDRGGYRAEFVKLAEAASAVLVASASGR